MDIFARLRKGLGVGLCLLLSPNLTAQGDQSREIELHYQRAQEALKASQPAAAIEEFRQILRINPNVAEAHANLGVIAFTQAQYQEAARDFRAALKLQPSLWNAQAFLGMCELRVGHTSEARPLLESSFKHLEEAKLRTQVGIDLIRIHQEAKNLDQAAEVLRVLERAGPNDPNILYLAYRIHADLAARALAALGQAAPDSARMHQILAETLESQDDFSRAIAQYRKALEADPRLPGIHLALARAILGNSHEEPARQEAEKEFAAELAADPTDANSEYELGEIYSWRSKPQQALQHYLRARELRPDFVDAEIALGKVLTTLDQPGAAIPHLRQAVRLDPQNEVAHYRLAQAYRKLGRAEDVDREMAAFQKLRNSHAPIRSLYQQIQQRPISSQTI